MTPEQTVICNIAVVVLIGLAAAFLTVWIISLLRAINTRKNTKTQGRNKMPSSTSSNKVAIEMTKNQSKGLKTILTNYIEENSDVAGLSGSEIHAIAHAKKLLEKLGE